MRVVQPSYEFFDHTADMGLRVRAESLTALLKPAADALYAAIGELATTGQPQSVPFDLRGDEPAVLLRDFLAELLVSFESDARIATSLDVTAFDDTGLRATASMSPIDPDRSVFHHEVKAITYHELAIRSIPGGLEATIIVDI